MYNCSEFDFLFKLYDSIISLRISNIIKLCLKKRDKGIKYKWGFNIDIVDTIYKYIKLKFQYQCF